MLSESFVTGFLTTPSPRTPSSLRDVGICVHEYLPVPAIHTAFKKSVTDRNCLAISQSHVFAAQSGKAVVLVFSRERKNQEALVPFPERIRSLAIAGGQFGDAEIVVCGTEGGRLIVWETHSVADVSFSLARGLKTSTGRQIFTSASHLQPVTSLVVDPTNSFILSGSDDANINVWSLPGLLSFACPPGSSQTHASFNTPVRTFSNHRAPITSIAVGHSINRNNIAISTSRDGTAIAWEYHSGKLLHTYLLSAAPLSLAVDPADRAFYVGYEDSSVQLIDFFEPSFLLQNPLFDSEKQNVPTQLSPTNKWTPPSSEYGAAECLTLSYDGTSLLSGHKGGVILRWDIPRARFASVVANIMSPVTNLHMLRPTGFSPDPSNQLQKGRVTVHNIVKPRVDTALLNITPGKNVPLAYTFQAHLTPPSTCQDDFSIALTHSSFPPELLSQGLLELASFNTNTGSSNNAVSTPVTSDASEAGEKSANSNSTAATTSSESESRLISNLQKEKSLLEKAMQSHVLETTRLRERLVDMEAYQREVYMKQQKSQLAKATRRLRRDQRGLEKREAWFAAEKQGRSGDAALRRMDEEDDKHDDEDDDDDETRMEGLEE